MSLRREPCRVPIAFLKISVKRVGAIESDKYSRTKRRWSSRSALSSPKSTMKSEGGHQRKTV